MSSSHTDGTGGVTRTYGILGNPYQTKTGNTVNAQYTYLSDGTRTKAVDSSGSGYAYMGSFVYNVSVNGETLESVAFGGGRIEKNGTGYEVAYHITDHLGSVRSIVKNGAIVEQNDYYPFGGRLADSANLIVSYNPPFRLIPILDQPVTSRDGRSYET